MIKLYEDQEVSIYQVQKDLGLGKYTLYRYASGERSVENMPVKILQELAKYFGMDIDIIYKKMKEYEEIREV